jgi:hypothetical protein
MSVKNDKIWRYMDLPKFLDLLQSKTLFFARVDELRKSDKFECAIMRRPPNQKIDFENQIKPPVIGLGSIYKKFIEQLEEDKINEKILNNVFINCWHINEKECNAMWKIYSDKMGLSITTSSDKLDDYLYQKVGEGNFCAMPVFYMGSEEISTKTAKTPFLSWFCKNEEFKYEKEFRCLIRDTCDSKQKSHIKLEIDLEQIIDEIYISPYAPNWYESCIKNLCNTYGISDNKVIKSY